MDFKAYAHTYGHYHGILHDNKLKFRTTMGFTIVNIVAIEKLFFRNKKYYINFQVPEMAFYEGST